VFEDKAGLLIPRALFFDLRHFWLQYLTESQWRSHFLRQLKGLPQTGHIFLGSSLLAGISFNKNTKKLNIKKGKEIEALRSKTGQAAHFYYL